MSPLHSKRPSAAATQWTPLAWGLAGLLGIACTGCGEAHDREAEAEAFRADLAMATAEYLPGRTGGELAQSNRGLQGAWRAIHIKVDGQELPKHDVVDATELLEFHEGHAWVRKGDRELLRGRYQLDESQSPHVIRIRSDLLTGDATGNHGEVHGIFEASDETLRICFTPVDRPVPEGFQPQRGVTCVTYQRVP